MICGDTPLMHGCMGGCLGQWLGSGQITKNQINFDLFEIFQLSLKIYDLWIHCPPMGGCLSSLMDGWVNGWGHVK